MATTTQTKKPAQSKTAAAKPAQSKTASAQSKTCAKGASCNCAKTKPTQKATAKHTKASAEFAQDMTKLNDKAIISDVLSSHKSLVKLYGTALCEVSCEKLRSLVGSQLTECAKDQFDAFLYMNQRNMYPTDPAPSAKVQKAKDKFAQQKCQMKK